MKKNFRKEDLAQNLRQTTGYSFLYSKKILNDLLFSIFEVVNNQNLNLKNFGVFKITFKKNRIGRNPKTNIQYKISERKTLKFNPSKKFSEFLN